MLNAITPERVANPEKVQPSRLRGGKIRDGFPFPCREEVEKYLLAWNKMEGYALQEDALYKLFYHTYPKNTDISEVLIKVSALNDFYGMNIFKIVPVAQLIISLNIDNRLAAGDMGLVMDIGYTELNNGAPHRYSFATKYCSHHNAQAFPIYDSCVDKILKYFNSIHSFSDFNRDEL